MLVRLIVVLVNMLHQAQRDARDERVAMKEERASMTDALKRVAESTQAQAFAVARNTDAMKANTESNKALGMEVRTLAGEATRRGA